MKIQKRRSRPTDTSRDGDRHLSARSPGLASALDDLRDRSVNYDADAAPPHVHQGWHHDRCAIELGREAPGEPAPGGLAETAVVLVDGYEFTNPHLLRAVYRAGPTLVGRDMLLEGRFLRMRFLLGVRVTEQHDEVRDGPRGAERAVGWSYQTLQGHLEQGLLTYEVVKELETGLVTFSITAYSRRAPVPNPVLRWGFGLFGRANQLRFYRHALRRLRVLAHQPMPPLPSPARPVTELAQAPTGAPPGRHEWLTVTFRDPGR